MRHVAAKTFKRIQKSSFFVGKRIHIPSYCACVCVYGLQENASSDDDDIGIARLLMVTAAMKNQTDRFSQQLSCLPDAVFTRLYLNPSFPPYNG